MKFRSDDVVRRVGGVEDGRVVYSRGVGTVAFVHVLWPSGREVWHAAENLEVVYRPVAVGDVLVESTSGRKHTAVAEDLDTEAKHWALWQHEDGTPCAPPVARERETLPAPTAEEPVPPGFEVIGRTAEGGRVLRAAPVRYCARPGCGAIIEAAGLSRYVAIEGKPGDFCTFECGEDRKPTLTAETLARALYRTHPAVLAFVAEKADAVCRDRAVTKTLQYDGQPLVFTCTVEKWKDERFARALDIAEQRREPAGVWEECELRAKAMKATGLV